MVPAPSTTGNLAFATTINVETLKRVLIVVVAWVLLDVRGDF